MKVITPDWPIGSKVLCFSTTREGGISEGAYASLNLGAHVGDESWKVDENRQRMSHYIDEQLSQQSAKSAEITWLHQTHSSESISLPDTTSIAQSASFDAAYTSSPYQPCVVMTADCMAIMVSSEDGNEVAAIHAGWRGLAGNVIENTIAKFKSNNEELHVWFAPCISAKYFEVGEDVASLFSMFSNAVTPIEAGQQASNSRGKKYSLDMLNVAREKLKKLGVCHFYQSNICTYSQSNLFSHRQASHSNLEACGRMANVILINNSHA